MADENWADQNDLQDVLTDDRTLANEADANGETKTNNDIVDEGAKPKRNRIPTAQTDENPDEVNSDEAPKPKRGRGRPRKEDELSQMAAMRKELDDIKRENDRLSRTLRNCTAEKDDLEKDLELTRSSLLERDHDYAELLEQFSNHEEMTAQTLVKPKGIVLYDDITESCVSNLKPSITWRKIKKSLDDVDESDGIKDADVVLIVTGAQEIGSGVTAFQLFQRLTKILNAHCEHTLFYVTTLPPNNNARLPVDLYNQKLASLEYENTKLLKVRFPGPKRDLVGYDGCTPNAKCASLYDAALQSISPPSTVKTVNPTPSASNADFVVTSITPVKSDMVGRIIGKNGNVIKKITTDLDVKMSFGTWKERTNETRDDDPESYTAVMIKGLTSNVQKAIDQVKEILGAKSYK